MNDLETAIFVLEEALTFSQDEPLNGDEFTIEMHGCLAEVLFQNDDIEKSLKRSTKILTVSQVRFCEFSPSVCLGTILITYNKCFVWNEKECTQQTIQVKDSDPRSYKITFTCILYPQCTHMIFIIYTSCHSTKSCVCIRRILVVASISTLNIRFRRRSTMLSHEDSKF